MKGYLEKIENILGFRLEEKSIMQADFPDSLLINLQEYLSGRPSPEESFEGSELSCFLSLPDILDGSFSAYVSGGDLEKHWPDDGQIANALLFHEKILIHDHLQHYVASSLNGYTIGYRYHGLKSWLRKLALWRPLIITGKIEILPKDLAYSPGMKSIWAEGLEQQAMDLLCYFDQIACDLIQSGYEQECIMEINEVMYLLAGLSIEKKSGRGRVPFFAAKEQFGLYQKVLTAFIELSKDKYRPGHQPGQKIPEGEALNMQLLMEESLCLRPEEINSFCDKIQEGLFADVRAELSEIIKQLSNQSNGREVFKQEMEAMLRDRQELWKEMMKEHDMQTDGQRSIHMQFASVFLQQISNTSTDQERQVDRIIFETLNTGNEEKTGEDRLGHYGFSIF